MPLSLANPQVTHLPSDEYYYEEGCLSFPDIRGDVARPERILVRYQDLDGATHELECDGLLARCIQHEADHLDGILFTERMEKEVYAEVKSEVKALKKKTIDTLKEGKLPKFQSQHLRSEEKHQAGRSHSLGDQISGSPPDSAGDSRIGRKKYAPTGYRHHLSSFANSERKQPSGGR